MRNVQVSIHVELFGDQRPRALRGTTERYGLHAYADSSEGFPEALLAAVNEVSRMYAEDVRTLGARVDGVSDATEDERAKRFLRMSEPPRPVDYMDVLLLADALCKERGEDDALSPSAHKVANFNNVSVFVDVESEAMPEPHVIVEFEGHYYAASLDTCEIADAGAMFEPAREIAEEFLSLHKAELKRAYYDRDYSWIDDK